jgi:hypothetical protein
VNIRLDYDWIDLETLELADAKDESVVETFVLLSRSNFNESRGKIEWPQKDSKNPMRCLRGNLNESQRTGNLFCARI